jgi:hypothetical protein
MQCPTPFRPISLNIHTSFFTQFVYYADRGGQQSSHTKQLDAVHFFLAVSIPFNLLEAAPRVRATEIFKHSGGVDDLTSYTLKLDS